MVCKRSVVTTNTLGYEFAVVKRKELVMGCMNFGIALEQLKRGKKVARNGWNGKGIFIELQVADENSKMSGSYTFIDTTGLQTDNEDAPRCLVPWLPSQTDMLAEDWNVVE